MKRPALHKGIGMSQRPKMAPRQVALLKWVEGRSTQAFSPCTASGPTEWRVELSMASVVGLEKRGYLKRHQNGIFSLTQLGREVAAMFEMPKNPRWEEEQKRWREEDAQY